MTGPWWIFAFLRASIIVVCMYVRATSPSRLATAGTPYREIDSDDS